MALARVESVVFMAVELTCCSQPTSAACQKGVPSVTVPGAAIYLNGKVCGG